MQASAGAGGDDEVVRLLGISRAFKLSKALNLAGKLGIVSLCASASDGLTLLQLCQRLGFWHTLRDDGSHPSGEAWPEGIRGPADYFDLLVSMHVLERRGDGPTAKYLPNPSTARLLLDDSPTSITGILTLNHDRSSPLFEFLEAGLQEGRVPEAARASVPDVQDVFSGAAGAGRAAGGAEHFALGMLGASIGNFQRLARVMDFSAYRHVVDIGGSTGACCVALCEAHPHLTAATCDLPAVRDTALSYVKQHGMESRVQVVDLDFFSDSPFPKADVVIMGMVLHDWGLEKKRLLMRKARAALAPGGAFVAVEQMVDDGRRDSAGPLASSLNMLLEFGREAAFDFSYAEFARWAADAGFARTACLPLLGNAAAAVAYINNS